MVLPTPGLLSDLLYFALCAFVGMVLLLSLRAGPERAAWRRVVQHWSGRVALLLLALFLLIGLADSLRLPQGPSGWAGAGRDVSLLDLLLQRFLTDEGDASLDSVVPTLIAQSFKGVRTAWLVGAAGLVACLPVAIVAGLGAGLIGGRLGRMAVGACDVLDAIPAVLLIILLIFVAQSLITAGAVSLDGPLVSSEARLLLVSLILGFSRVPALCRRIAARTTRFMVSDAVVAARCVGVTDAQLLRRRLLPEIVSMAAVALATALPMLMLIEAMLSYLGMGFDPVTRSLGTVLADALAIAASGSGAVEVLAAALLPLGLMLAAAVMFALAVNAAFGSLRN